MSIFKIRQEIKELRDNNPNFLYLCQIHINYECNILKKAKCREFCYQMHNSLEPMIFETFKGIIDHYTPRQIALGGGEPTLHPNFLKFIKYAKKEAKTPVKHVNYTTNGVKLPKNFDLIKNLVSGISISLDTLRYPNLFETGIPEPIKRNLIEYQKSPIQVILNYVVNEDNLPNLMDLIPFMKKNNLDIVYLLSYKAKGYFFPFSRQEFRRKFMTFLEEAFKNQILVGLDCCFSTFEKGKNQCEAGKKFLAFNSDGTHTPCSFADILGDKPCPFIKFVEDMEEMKKIRKLEIVNCK